MRYKNILSEKLDWILEEMVEYSFTSGDFGKDLLVLINLIYNKYNGYNAGSFYIKSSETEKFESRSNSNSRPKYIDIYHSKYDYINDSYKIKFNHNIINLGKNIEELKNKIRNIETLAIDICNTVVNSYLDPSKECKKIAIFFKRDISDYNGIIKEIGESIIFGRSISSNNYKLIEDYNKIIEEIEESTIFGKLSTIFRRFIFKNNKSKDQPVYMFIASKERETDLDYPNYYGFVFIIYVKEKEIYKW
jgi:archaellum component FlaC